jgi:hypothetical protein
MWDWGDGNFSAWLGPFDSGTIATTNYSWSKGKQYTIKVKARDSQHEESDWSDSYNVSVSRQITITHPQIGFLYIQIGLGLDPYNDSYFHSNLLRILGITGFLSIGGYIPVRAQANDAVHSVKIELNNLMIGDPAFAIMTKIDDNTSDGVEAIFQDVNQGNMLGIFDLSTYAYDEDGYLIDINTIRTIFLDIRRQQTPQP